MGGVDYLGLNQPTDVANDMAKIAAEPGVLYLLSVHRRKSVECRLNKTTAPVDDRGRLFYSEGGGGGTRTPDLYSAIVALSQLSYAPTRRHTQYMDIGRAASKSGADE